MTSPHTPLADIGPILNSNVKTLNLTNPQFSIGCCYSATQFHFVLRQNQKPPHLGAVAEAIYPGGMHWGNAGARFD
jgi:hypothetical protein